MEMTERLANLFTGVNPTPPTGTQITPPVTSIPPGAGATAPATSQTAANGVIPPSPKETAPLDEYKDLWDNDPNEQPKPDRSMFGEVNGDDLLKAAGNIDFTKVITPDIAQAIQAGGEEGTKALITAMNKVQQLGYAQSAHATTKLIEQAIDKARTQFEASIPTLLRNETSSNLVKENPVLSHPATAPIISGLVSQLQVKYPNASPSEINKIANDYVTNFSKAVLAPQQAAAANSTSKGNKETDWEDFFKD